MQEKLDYIVLYRDNNNELRSSTYEKADSVLHVKELFHNEYKYESTTFVAVISVPTGTDCTVYANCNGFLDVV